MKPSTNQSADLEQVLAFRLEGQHLARRLPPGSLLSAAGACGIQNTPPGSAALALHARVSGLSAEEVNQALVGDRLLLQAWSLRASPHLFPTREAAVFTLGLLPVDEESIRSFIKGVEPALDKIGIAATEVVRLTSEALQDSLDGRAMTKDELGIELARWIAPKLTPSQLLSWGLPSWYAPGQSLGESVVRFALPITALQGLYCHADRRGSKAYLMRTDQWLGGLAPESNREQARAELVRRFLRCYGPSSTEHFAEWAGIGPAQAAQAWKLVESELVRIDFDGRETCLLQPDLERFMSPATPAGVRFLPPNDPYLKLRDRATLVPDKTQQRQLWLRSGNPGVVLADGRLAAIWRPEKKGNRLLVTVESAAYLPNGIRSEIRSEIRSQIEAEAEGLAPYRGCASVEVKYTQARQG